MNSDQFETNTNEPYFIRPFQADEVDVLVSICDLSVGKNLYTREEILSSVDSDERHIYLAISQNDEIIGYLYYQLTDTASVESYTKLPLGTLGSVLKGKQDSVGLLQSIGVLPKWRNFGIAKQLVEYAMEKLTKQNVSYAVAACWKHGSAIPMQKNMEELGFQRLPGAYRIWYDLDRLICPFCSGRCKCEAVIYYTCLQ